MTVTGKALPVLATLLSWRSCSPLVVPKSIGVVVVPRRSPSSSIRLRASTLSSPSSSASSPAAAAVGPHIPIDETYPGLRRVHANPDVYVLENFLDGSSCDDLIARASERNMEQSPVAYAGWTSDLKDLLELAAKGPVSWLALLGSWYQTHADGGGNVELVVRAVQNFAVLFVLAAAAIAAFTKSRADGLQELRTSTSTTIDDLSDERGRGAASFVRNTARLFTDGGEGGADRGTLRREAALFEAPTVIRYEAGQVLAPHFDANRSAQTEDANRGGQTLATLLVYLNDVERGGLTRFGRLTPSRSSAADVGGSGEEEEEGEGETALTVRPKRGDALLFFPADASGRFDERAEHEGCPAVDEKWIARIWRHEGRVPPPFGLSDRELDRI